MSKVTKYISPYLSIPNQGEVGFCVGNAFATMMEILMMNALQSENVPELSRLYLQAECKACDGVKDNQGTYPGAAASILKNKGICEESIYPYDITDDVFNLKFPPRTSEMHVNAKQSRIKSYTTTKSISTIKDHILKYGACTFTNRFYEEKFSKNAIIAIGKQLSGEHETCVIGFDDELEYKGHKGYFIRLNSDHPRLGYAYGVELIPYDLLSTRWFVKATLCTPVISSTYLQDKYSGKGITLPVDTIELKIGSSKACVNGEEIQLNYTPQIIDSTTMVGIRVIDLFRKCYVNWESNSKPIIIGSQEGDFYFKLGDQNIRNGYGEVVYTAAVSPQLINGSTYIPLRAIAEVLGAKVDYIPETKEIKIVR